MDLDNVRAGEGKPWDGNANTSDSTDQSDQALDVEQETIKAVEWLAQMTKNGGKGVLKVRFGKETCVL